VVAEEAREDGIARASLSGDDAGMDDRSSVPIPPESVSGFRSGQPETGTILTDVAAAAAMLGVTESAVLKRLRAGTLDGCKSGGRWQVVVPESGSAGTERKPRPEFQRGNRIPEANRNDEPERAEAVPAVSEAARSQFAVLVEELLAPIVARHGEEMRDAGEAIGRLQTERDHAAEERDQAVRERDALRAEADRLRVAEDAPVAAPDAPHATEPAGVPPSPPRPWWRFWER